MNRNYFPNCIRCSDHYLDAKQKDFFHKDGCGLLQYEYLPFEEINKRLNERLEVFEQRHGVDGHGIRCKACANAAYGVMRIFYHNTNTAIDEWPVCMDHAVHKDGSGRKSKFVAFKPSENSGDAFSDVLADMVKQVEEQ